MILSLVAAHALAADDLDKAEDTDKVPMEEVAYELYEDELIEALTSALVTADGESESLSGEDKFPEPDPTPPEVRLWVAIQNASGKVVADELVTTQPVSMTAGLTDTVVLIASANETAPGGLASVEIIGETADECIDPSGALGQRANATWFVDNQDPDPMDSNRYTWLAVGLDFTMPAVACPTGWSSTSSRAEFGASALNLDGYGATTALVTITRR